jgi:hypothetical protein
VDDDVAITNHISIVDQPWERWAFRRMAVFLILISRRR